MAREKERESKWICITKASVSVWQRVSGIWKNVLSPPGADFTSSVGAPERIECTRVALGLTTLFLIMLNRKWSPAIECLPPPTPLSLYYLVLGVYARATIPWHWSESSRFPRCNVTEKFHFSVWRERQIELQVGETRDEQSIYKQEKERKRVQFISQTSTWYCCSTSIYKVPLCFIYLNIHIQDMYARIPWETFYVMII